MAYFYEAEQTNISVDGELIVGFSDVGLLEKPNGDVEKH